MNKVTPPRQGGAAPEFAAGVRPGAGVFGLARPDHGAKSAQHEEPEAEPSSEGRLIVGEGIQVKGEIESCDTLIVEGRVEASLEARELTVSKGGVYNGTAAVRAASVDGVFDGTLTVDGLLTIKAGGRVSGTLRYRDLEIEQGGRISGDIDLLPEGAAARREVPKAAKKAAKDDSDDSLLENAIAR